MNSEKLSTINGIIFELYTLRKSENEVRTQVFQVIKYTPIWFSPIFIVRRILKFLLFPIILFYIGFFVGLDHDVTIEKKNPTVVKSNENFCVPLQHNLRSPSLIPTDPNDQATTIGGAITTFPWSAWDEGLAERLKAFHSQ